MEYSNIRHVRILYKTILKLHRGLPKEMEMLGTSYAKDEFKRHKTCSSQEANIFISEWTKYAISLAEQLELGGRVLETNTKQIGSSLSKSDMDQLRDEQIHQLYELMKATKASSVK